MKKLLYILLALPLLTACREKKETAGAAAMYTPEVSVASPLIKDITLTKDYRADCQPRSTCERHTTIHLFHPGQPG